ncbi:hypothetical protein BESB_030400 [Besnoitia besnoiti]|uniref:Uncharacterized protein n=1 Tax=Besnoitia besnoiti TaxID=94643 RepID=A0A2A9M5J8_BESBE|nr:hypothetical protein BESB_030400 [Besnoitia besnoiti]PFH31166.1 hypothetical protein BESB_030400 [Besnoitia besnoiti]
MTSRGRPLPPPTSFAPHQNAAKPPPPHQNAAKPPPPHERLHARGNPTSASHTSATAASGATCDAAVSQLPRVPSRKGELGLPADGASCQEDDPGLAEITSEPPPHADTLTHDRGATGIRETEAASLGKNQTPAKVDRSHPSGDIGTSEQLDYGATTQRTIPGALPALPPSNGKTRTASPEGMRGCGGAKEEGDSAVASSVHLTPSTSRGEDLPAVDQTLLTRGGLPSPEEATPSGCFVLPPSELDVYLPNTRESRAPTLLGGTKTEGAAPATHATSGANGDPFSSIDDAAPPEGFPHEEAASTSPDAPPPMSGRSTGPVPAPAPSSPHQKAAESCAVPTAQMAERASPVHTARAPSQAARPGVEFAFSFSVPRDQAGSATSGFAVGPPRQRREADETGECCAQGVHPRIPPTRAGMLESATGPFPRSQRGPESHISQRPAEEAASPELSNSEENESRAHQQTKGGQGAAPSRAHEGLRDRNARRTEFHPLPTAWHLRGHRNIWETPETAQPLHADEQSSDSAVYREPPPLHSESYRGPSPAPHPSPSGHEAARRSWKRQETLQAPFAPDGSFVQFVSCAETGPFVPHPAAPDFGGGHPQWASPVPLGGASSSAACSHAPPVVFASFADWTADLPGGAFLPEGLWIPPVGEFLPFCGPGVDLFARLGHPADSAPQPNYRPLGARHTHHSISPLRAAADSPGQARSGHAVASPARGHTSGLMPAALQQCRPRGQINSEMPRCDTGFAFVSTRSHPCGLSPSRAAESHSASGFYRRQLLQQLRLTKQRSAANDALQTKTDDRALPAREGQHRPRGDLGAEPGERPPRAAR